MPLFFFLSGLFAERSLSKGRMAFLRGRIIGMVYPYLLWIFIQTGLNIAAGDLVNTPARWGVLGKVLWDPAGQFWFIYALLICQLLLLLPRALFYFLIPIGLILSFSFGGAGIVVRALGSLVYFGAGVFVTAPQLTALTQSKLRQILLFVGGFGAYALLFVEKSTIVDRPVLFFIMSIVAATAGVIGTIGFARLVSPYDRVLRALGGASMPIYLVHVIAAAAVRIILAHSAMRGAAIISLLIVTLAGLILPYLLYRIAQRLGLSVWLGFGGPPRRGVHLSSPPPAAATTP
jgi:fucose 4-O-acetylase-like acetyltransferase